MTVNGKFKDVSAAVSLDEKHVEHSTFNGVVQDLGTYFYTIIVARPGGDGENIVYKGDVTLIK